VGGRLIGLACCSLLLVIPRRRDYSAGFVFRKIKNRMSASAGMTVERIPAIGARPRQHRKAGL
jgi:hypothetical protein